MALDLNGLIFSLSAYLLGSIPFGLVVSRVCGTQDPRQAGSGNIGFTNVLRLSGKKNGLYTLLGDWGKGYIVGWAGITLYSCSIWGFVGMLAVVLGHMFPVFLAFRGGKGVATGLGVILGYHVGIGFMLVLIWLASIGIWRYSSGGALLSFGLFPIISVAMVEQSNFFIFSMLLSGLIIVKHSENIQRLLQGTESKI